jgi:hypothetical protein
MKYKMTNRIYRFDQHLTSKVFTIRWNSIYH